MGRQVYPLTVTSVSYHYKNPTKRVDFVQRGDHLIELLFVLALIWLEKNAWLGVKQESVTHPN